MTGLVAAGRTLGNSATVRKACDFLLSKQLPSGGWGESYLSSHDEVTFTSALSVWDNFVDATILMSNIDFTSIF